MLQDRFTYNSITIHFSLSHVSTISELKLLLDSCDICLVLMYDLHSVFKRTKSKWTLYLFYFSRLYGKKYNWILLIKRVNVSLTVTYKL